MRKLFAVIIVLLLFSASVFADGITVPLAKVWESTVDTQGGRLFSIDSTYEGLCYIELSAFDQSNGAAIKMRKFNKITKIWGTEVTDVYSNASADPNSFACRVIGTKLHVFVTRRTNGTFKDVVHFTSTDLTFSSWTSPEVLYIFTVRRGNVHGNMIYITDRNEWWMPFYSHSTEATNQNWREGYFVSTDAGVTWTLNETAIYGGPGSTRYWGELSLAYAGNCRVVAILRNNLANTKLGQSVTTDCGDHWTNPDADFTNMGYGASGGVIIPELYYDSAIDRFIAVVHDRAPASLGGLTTKVYIASSDAVIQDPDNWGSIVFTIDSYFAAGYPTMDKIDSDEYLIIIFREDIDPSTATNRNLTDIDPKYLIYQINQGTPPVDPCPPTCPDPDVTTNADYSGINIEGLDIK